ncbi:kinase-like protein [Choiromyces venosus 120613-1]|uniref:non-specific serine/threonine protein kinase n=1 Tax=Choiromyces venosus 120613-1 TaxID=1336337 RepID=A0A3N4J8D8_9PEZI|nr:kinase-like protein [Choiromyces venosus 120613-1]
MSQNLTSRLGSTEPRDKTPEPSTEETEPYGAPVREPPAWKLNYTIGSGSFGTVFLEKVQTRAMEEPELWAVKRISRTVPNFPAKRYKDEIKNFQALSAHEWFVKFNSSYEDAHHVYIAMEYIQIGDMAKTFGKGYRWNESDTKVVIEQLLQGLVVMHKEGITHRDLKPENIFLCLEGRILRVKIGDFGTSKRIPISSTGTYLKTTTGTQSYMAPEMDDTSKAKTNRVDIWSLGCVLYRMIAGGDLFLNRTQVWRYSMDAAYVTQAIEGKGLSVPCVDFLRKVLQADPKQRPSAEACLKMAWITSKAPGSRYSIGGDLYKMLARIKHDAPDIDSYTDTASSQVVIPSAPGMGFPSSPAPVSNSVGGTSETTKTFDTISTVTS